MGFWHTHGSPNLGQKRRLENNQFVDFTAPADHRIKLKECEKKNKYLDLAKELKNLWNMHMTIIPIVIRAFGTVTKGLLRDWKTWKLTDEWRPSKLLHYWERPECWEESRRLDETCCHSDSSKNHQLKLMWKTLIIIIIINLKRETESLLIAAQNNAMRTKPRIGRTQQNGKCRLCSDKDETINHIIIECSKLALKETTQTKALLRMARILRRVLKTWVDLQSLKL